jgi:8-oxo-dGTP diphosphatase
MQTLSTVRSIILNPDGHILIVRRSKTDPLHGGKWDLPGGRVEAGETVETALGRETMEEVGLHLVDPRLFFATSDVRSGISKTWIFFVVTLQKDADVALGDEHDEYKWIQPSALPTYTDYDILLRLHAYITNNRLPLKQSG